MNMPLLDSLLSVFAPHNCLGCSSEGSLLCKKCVAGLPRVSGDTCLACFRRPARGMLCDTCVAGSSMTAVMARTTHDGVAKQLVGALKFNRALAAAKPMAHAMSAVLPKQLQGVLITSVPTATSRVRQRGYDQAAVLARLIAKEQQLSYCSLLGRTSQLRQVGASRQQRQAQLKDIVYVRRQALCKGATIIVVDDVLTTGSSVEASAKALRAAGASRIFGLVFAWQTRS